MLSIGGMREKRYSRVIETKRSFFGIWISMSYVQYFHTKRKRSGHLFQARFKSILIEADEYLTHLSRYIHQAPLRAKMVVVFN